MKKVHIGSHYTISELPDGSLHIEGHDCDFVKAHAQALEKEASITFHKIPKTPDWFTYHRKNFKPISGKPEGVVLTEVSEDEVGLHDQRYQFTWKPDTHEYWLQAPFYPDYSKKETPPYSLLISGTFYKGDDGKIYYNGGFSIM